MRGSEAKGRLSLCGVLPRLSHILVSRGSGAAPTFPLEFPFAFAPAPPLPCSLQA